MATVSKPTTRDANLRPAKPASEEELRRRNQAAIALLDKWERDGDIEEQRATMAVLRDALGENRELSSRPIFP